MTPEKPNEKPIACNGKVVFSATKEELYGWHNEVLVLRLDEIARDLQVNGHHLLWSTYEESKGWKDFAKECTEDFVNKCAKSDNEALPA